ncbi:MAG TPA: amino acid ABC transporter substrate-binding protein [Geminicoccaceae bacterium]|nr:amino acid ABC transporter substrate-binding protein [Geminicoccaceae bacterium]
MTRTFTTRSPRATRRKMLHRAALAGALALASTSWAGAAGAQDDPIRIGFSMALTGGLAGAGKPALIAMEIWRDDVNAAGGLLGRPVEFVYYDDQTQPATVPRIYTKLLTVDDVDLVVSGYGTNLTAPAMPIVMRHGMTFMSLFALGANEEFDYDRYFQIMPAGPEPKEDWSRPFIKLAVDHGLETIALVGADAEFAQNAVDGARINAQEAGLEIVYDQSYPPNTTDFTSIIRAIQATNPDVVFVGSYPPDSAGMVRAANELDLQTNLFGGGMVGLQYASLQTSLGPMLNGIVNYDFWVPEPTLDFPGIQEFLAKYQERAEGQGVDPLGHYLPPFAYAYMQVLGDAVEAVGSLDQEALADYIRDNEFDTVVGPVRFGPRGEWATSRVLMVQFQNIENGELEQFKHAGKRVVILPDEWASGELIFPYTDAKK